MTPARPGIVEDGYEDLAAELERLTRSAAVSAQLTVIVDQRTVVATTAGPDLDIDSLAPVLSVSKGMTGICIGRLVEEGVLDLDRLVTDYWPAYAAEGKGGTTVLQALSHQAGIPAFEDPRDDWLEDDEAAAAALARQAPLWQPGKAVSYHPVTIGTIAGELCRRAAGVNLQTLYEHEIRAPRDLDAYLGIPDSAQARVVMVPIATSRSDDGSLTSIVEASLRGRFDLDALANDARSHLAGNPAAGGVASATGLAELYAASLLDFGGPFSAATRQRLSRVAVAGADLASGEPTAFGVLFQKQHGGRQFAGFTAYGHEGAGGALAYADPSLDLAFAFVPSRDPGEALVDQLSRTARRLTRARLGHGRP